MKTETVHLPCITLIQPWATWIMLGWKTIETRTHNRFSGLSRMQIGIHAGKSWDHIAAAAASRYLRPDQMQKYKDDKFNEQFPFGALIATAFVYQFRPLFSIEDSRDALIDCTNTKRYGLFLRDIKPIDPIKISGKQGLWYYDGQITEPDKGKR